MKVKQELLKRAVSLLRNGLPKDKKAQTTAKDLERFLKTRYQVDHNQRETLDEKTTTQEPK
jgi:hypothetical protein